MTKITKKKRKIFVTTALPYANGKFHIGHIMEYIQADIWVRFQKMLGNEVNFVGADDAHGAPIMIAAEKANKTPEEFVKEITKDRQDYLNGFYINFDNWYSTHSPENIELSQQIYKDLVKANLIESKIIEQFFDPEKQIFLPDRFIKGQCPKCRALDQFGDNCEVCGSVYNPTELINPYSALSGAKPILKESEHLFFKLSDKKCVEFLKEWTQNGIHVQPEVANKIREWLPFEKDNRNQLNDWDISRDYPYFGIEIPGKKNKYFYVWLDAPVGYLASLKNLLEKRGENYLNYINDKEVEQYHFIGKDIITFHTLFWPAMLYFSGRKTPNKICVHGFMTVNNGEKMSKSRGTGLDPLKYLNLKMNPEWLRYYISAKLNGKNEDIDFNSEDFILRVNSDLIGKYINIASRSANFINKNFEGKLSNLDNEGNNLINNLKEIRDIILDSYENCDTAKVAREIALLCDKVNIYIAENKPWEIAKLKDKENNKKLQQVCSTCIESFKILTIYVKPILPNLAKQIEDFLNIKDLSFEDINNLLGQNHKINSYKHLMQRIEEKQLEHLFINEEIKMIEKAKKNENNNEINENYINIEDFNKIDLRVAKIINCENVEGSNKLLKFTLDVGEKENRIIFSGVASSYKNTEELIGKLTVIVSNLKPRKMRFGFSQGMVLSASNERDEMFYILEPLKGAKAGMKIS